ncbi:pyridoxal phosphate-dependent aminotransferase [Campylobacter geochelonis]|uniref:Aspartate aminotransferase n=1 Tax=Campylobacter geochelonis TaxID=1780362 RepID=A0A128EIJ0_9BACT|nr:pyridoxal phosphate-dependent aminotransferase [Campylobacter geochelonis]QKF71308.1 aspartate aminotransferase, class I and II aminotransferase [Campylobacter geochelonis]CZE48070.1 aspartate aminotransferase [Campylobacter geochelonis]CZE48182.1 aspartate aminotransferase [Campylobacter geochelonis]CZE51073.1 aspartate aminotransferase [Campylobacter geochelonis]
MLSKRSQVLSESITIAISSMAKDMKAKGEDVISLSAGEPDFDTPKAIKDAVVEAMKKGCAKYTAVPGTPEVIKAIQTKLRVENNLEYQTNQIITTVGAKQGLFAIFQCLIDDGDEVIIPAPYWVSYPEMVKFCGGKPVFIEGDEHKNFKITAEQLKAAITPKTKAFVLGNPGNPSGNLYSKAELIEFAKVLKDTKVLVISDEIYEKINYVGEFTAAASINEDMFKRTITINGLSKAGAMTGWRFGYLACVLPELISAIKKVQSQSVSNISSIVQAGAIPALLGKTDDDIENMRKAYQERRDWMVDAINAIDGLSVVKPDGAFYLFINCKAVEKDSMKFCKELLAKEKVATVPGVGFGMDGYFRASYATDLDSIKKAVARIAKFVKEYKA